MTHELKVFYAMRGKLQVGPEGDFADHLDKLRTSRVLLPQGERELGRRAVQAAFTFGALPFAFEDWDS